MISHFIKNRENNLLDYVESNLLNTLQSGNVLDSNTIQLYKALSSQSAADPKSGLIKQLVEAISEDEEEGVGDD